MEPSSSTSSSRNPFRRLLCRALALGGAVGLTIFCGLWFAPADPHKYIAAIVDKDRLLHTVEHPALFVVGGSSSAFGVDSSILESFTNRDVVNLGLHERIGLRYMLAHLEPFLTSGDVVLLTPEPGVFLSGRWRGGRALSEALAQFPGGSQYLTPADLEVSTFLLGLQSRLRRAVWPVQEGVRVPSVYDRQAFDANGDLRGAELEQARLPLPPAASIELRGEIDPRAVELVNSTAVRWRGRGVAVVLDLPPLPREWVLGGAAGAEAYLVSLRGVLDPQIVSKPHSLVLDRELFFDDVQHLNEAGRRYRSLGLGASLCAVLQDCPAATSASSSQ